MNKKLLVIILAILLLIGGGFAYLLTQDQQEEAVITNNEETTNPVSPPPVPTPGGGTYTTYDEANLKTTAGTKVIFFHAAWCPQCRALEADIQEGPIPQGVTIYKVDYDTNQDLRKKYGVTIQTTLVKVDDDGNLIKKFVAYDEPTLESLKQNLL